MWTAAKQSSQKWSSAIGSQPPKKQACGCADPDFEPLPLTSERFEANFARIVSGFPEIAGKRPSPSSGVTSNGHPIVVERRCCARREGISVAAVHVGIEAPWGHIFLGLITVGGNNEQKTQSEADLEAVVRFLLPTPEDKPFELAAPEDGGGLEGVYTYLDTGLRPNAFGGGMDFYSENKIILFDRSGLSSRRIPRGDGDIEAHCKAGPTDSGVYRPAGGSHGIELTKVLNGFGVLETKTRPFERKGEVLQIGKAKYRPVPPPSRGARLDGV